MDFLRDNELPAGIRYPGAFARLVARRSSFLEPWRLLEGDQLRQRYRGLRERFPARTLVPFARREDNDDVACWEVGKGEGVVLIHDFAKAGTENRGEFPDFYAWLRQAVEDLIEFDAGEEP